MARNYVQPGTVLEITAAANLNSGTPVAVGAVVGVALGAIANGARGQAQVEGVFDLPKATGVAFTAGQRLNFRPSAGNFTTATAVAGDLLGAGVAVNAAAAGDTTCRVRLSPGVATIQP